MFAAVVFKHSAPIQRVIEWEENKKWEENIIKDLMDKMLYSNTVIVFLFYLASFVAINIITGLGRWVVKCFKDPPIENEDGLAD